MKELWRGDDISIGIDDDLRYYCGEYQEGELVIHPDHGHFQTLWRTVRYAAHVLAKKKALHDEVNNLHDYMQELLGFERRMKEMLGGV